MIVANVGGLLPCKNRAITSEMLGEELVFELGVVHGGAGETVSDRKPGAGAGRVEWSVGPCRADLRRFSRQLCQTVGKSDLPWRLSVGHRVSGPMVVDQRFGDCSEGVKSQPA